MKIPFLTSEDEASAEISTSGELRSLIKQTILFIGLPIMLFLGVSALVPTTALPFVLTIMLVVYIVAGLGWYFKVADEARSYLCFAKLHWRFPQGLRLAVDTFIGPIERLDTTEAMRQYFLTQKDILDQRDKQVIENAMANIARGYGRYYAFDLVYPKTVKAGPFHEIDGVILHLKSDWDETFEFTANCEVIYKDFPVTKHSRSELAAFVVDDFIDVGGRRYAIAHLGESTLKEKNIRATFKGDESQSASRAYLLALLDRVMRFAADVAASYQGMEKFILDREHFVDSNVDFLIRKYRVLDEVPTKPFWRRIGIKKLILIAFLVIVAILVLNYFGLLPRFR